MNYGKRQEQDDTAETAENRWIRRIPIGFIGKAIWMLWNHWKQLTPLKTAEENCWKQWIRWCPIEFRLALLKMLYESLEITGRSWHRWQQQPANENRWNRWIPMGIIEKAIWIMGNYKNQLTPLKTAERKSKTAVSAEFRLVLLKSYMNLWKSLATADTAEQRRNTAENS